MMEKNLHAQERTGEIERLRTRNAVLEKRLQESEERFRTMAGFCYSSETWRGADGNFIYIAPSFLRITGYTQEHFYNDPLLLETIAHPDDKEIVSDHVRKPSGADAVFHREFRLITRSGEERWISHFCRPVFGQDGAWLGRRVSDRDITGRKRLEQERELLIDDLKQALSKVRTLSGFLPICASCKKIRDDKGYWKQIESYIRDHSEAEFSHSICPECAKKLYPDLYKEQ